MAAAWRRAEGQRAEHGGEIGSRGDPHLGGETRGVDALGQQRTARHPAREQHRDRLPRRRDDPGQRGDGLVEERRERGPHLLRIDPQ